MSDASDVDQRQRFVTCSLRECAAIHKLDRVGHVRRILESTGSTLKVRLGEVSGRLFSRPGADGLRTLNRQRTIYQGAIRHPLLGDEELVLSYAVRERTLGLTVDASCLIRDSLDRTVMSILAYARLLQSVFRPLHGWVGETTVDLIRPIDLREHRLTRLYWANFLGPSLVEEHGAKYFLAIPGWHAEELDDGSLLYIVSEHFSDFERRQPWQPIAYLLGRFPDVRWAERGILDF